MAKERSQRTPEDRAPMCHICTPPRRHFGLDHTFKHEAPVSPRKRKKT